MSKLFSKLKLGSIELKNRVIMPPMCTYQVSKHDGIPTDFHFLHYSARALGGVGMIIVEATAVQENGRITENDLGLWNDNQISAHQKLVEGIEKYGAVPAIQLAHAGRKAEVPNNVSVTNEPFSDEYHEPYALDESDVEKLKQDFKAAAIRAKQAGYKVVEIHAAHGYLLNTFLSPLVNNRDWKYGGSFENRVKILEELVPMLKETGLEIGIRISATSWRSDDYGMDESIKLAKLCEKLGLAFIHVSSGGLHNKVDAVPVIAPLYQAEYAKQIKDVVNIPVIAVGLITKASEAEALLLADACDAVAFGRGLLNNANLAFEMAAMLKEKSQIHSSYLRAYRI